MAYVKIIEKGNNGKYHDLDSYHDLITYCCDPEKAVATGFANVTSINSAAAEMEHIAMAFKKLHGKKISHIIITFSPEDLRYVALDSIQQIAQNCIRCFSDRYQIVYGIHSYPQPHIHIIMNRVSFVDGTKYPDRYEDRNRFWRYLYNILSNYNIRLWKN